MSNQIKKPASLLNNVVDAAPVVKRKPLGREANEVMVNLAVYELAKEMNVVFFRCTTKNVDRKIAQQLDQYNYVANYGGRYPKIYDLPLTDDGRSYVQSKFAKEIGVEVAWLKWGQALDLAWENAAKTIEATARRKFPKTEINVSAQFIPYTVYDKCLSVRIYPEKERVYTIRYDSGDKRYAIEFNGALKITSDNTAVFAKEFNKMAELLTLVEQTVVMEPDIQDFLPQPESEETNEKAE